MASDDVLTQLLAWLIEESQVESFKDDLDSRDDAETHAQWDRRMQAAQATLEPHLPTKEMKDALSDFGKVIREMTTASGELAAKEARAEAFMEIKAKIEDLLAAD